MSSFEEAFPSLKFSARQGEFDITSKGYSCWTMERFLEDIQKHCLDKQRVREAINKLFNRRGLIVIDYPENTNTWEFSKLKEELLKELGLEVE